MPGAIMGVEGGFSSNGGGLFTCGIAYFISLFLLLQPYSFEPGSCM